MLKFKPLGDKVVVKPLEAAAKSKGGILLPDMAKEKPQMGEVITVGPGRRMDNGDLIKPAVKAGDVVYYSKYCGTDIKIDDVEYKIMHEEDILGIG